MSADAVAPPRRADGSCLCGAVGFSAGLPSKWVAHCHCTRCQRAHGAAFVTWVGVEADGVAVRDPDHRLHWYVAPDADGERAFCSVCGSSLFFRGARWPAELHIARALFSGSLDREPQAHAYFDSHVGWVRLGDDLPTLADPAAGA